MSEWYASLVEAVVDATNSLVGAGEELQKLCCHQLGAACKKLLVVLDGLGTAGHRGMLIGSMVKAREELFELGFCIRPFSYVAETWAYRPPDTVRHADIKDLLALLDAQLPAAPTRLVLVGHSLGGIIAAEWLDSRPHRRKQVDGIALVATPVSIPLCADWRESDLSTFRRSIPRVAP